MREDIQKLIEEAEREIDNKIIERDRNYYRNRNNAESEKIAKDECGVELNQIKESVQDEPEMN